MIKRKQYKFKRGDIIDVTEYHDGKYGKKGEKREEKKQVTPEDVERVNQYNKTRLARYRLLEYFNAGDLFATLTYDPEKRPSDMDEAKEDFVKVRRFLKKQYAKAERELFWIRNIEKGTKGAWHIHVVLNEIGNTASLLKKVWSKGAIYISEIRNNSKIYDEDFTKLASYITKSEKTRIKKADGEYAKPRIKESSYSTSRNMPLPEPKVDKLVRGTKEIKARKGYYITSSWEGINPKTGYRYRHYTMIKIGKGIDLENWFDYEEG